MPDITISASVVAWYGAVVATIGLLTSLYVALRDRPRIRIKTRADYVIHGAAGPYDPTKTYIMVTVSNAGRRPVTITHVYLTHYKIKQHSLLTDALVRGPTEITEGKAASFLVEQDALDLADIKAVNVIDATGREWKRPFSD